jgi:diaminopimelate decarboxylase
MDLGNTISKTPYFLYSELNIVIQIQKLLNNGIIEKNIYYSLMANNNIQLLQIIKENGLGVFTSSLSEIQIALHAGFNSKQIIFCSSNLNLREIQQLVDIDPVIIADSYNQLLKYLNYNKLKQIGIRISFAPEFYKTYGALEIQRQGLSEEQLPAAIELCRNKKVQIIGIHSYLGTNISNVEFYKAGISKLLKCVSSLNDLSFIDLSGGFGLDFSKENSDFNISDVVKFFDVERQKYSKLSSLLEFKIEPGRFIISPAGNLICTVIEIIEKDGNIFIGVDANLSNFPRPYIYKDYHLITVCDREVRHDKILSGVYIVGNTAKSDDFLAQNIEFPEVQEGDRLCIHYAGAYCYSMSSNFCAQLKPAEYLITKENELVKIREEETLDSFLNTQRL